MKFLPLYCIIVVLLSSCYKEDHEESIHYFSITSTNDTVDVIYFTSYNLTSRFDTAGNDYIKEIFFGKEVRDGDRINLQIKGHYSAYNNADYQIRYIGESPLFTLKNIQARDDTSLTCNISNAMIGKNVFEVYDNEKNILIQRLIASEDSVKIKLLYNKNSITSSETITSAFQFYLRPNNLSLLSYAIMK